MWKSVSELGYAIEQMQFWGKHRVDGAGRLNLISTQGRRPGGAGPAEPRPRASRGGEHLRHAARGGEREVPRVRVALPDRLLGPAHGLLLEGLRPVLLLRMLPPAAPRGLERLHVGDDAGDGRLLRGR